MGWISIVSTACAWRPADSPISAPTISTILPPPKPPSPALGRPTGPRGRSDLRGGSNGRPFFADYAQKPEGLPKTLGALGPYAPNRLIVVFGCGGDRDAGKRPMMGAIAAQLADCVIV